MVSYNAPWIINNVASQLSCILGPKFKFLDENELGSVSPLLTSQGISRFGSRVLWIYLKYLFTVLLRASAPSPSNLQVFISAAGNLHKAVGLEVTQRRRTDCGGDGLVYAETYHPWGLSRFKFSSEAPRFTTHTWMCIPTQSWCNRREGSSF